MELMKLRFIAVVLDAPKSIHVHTTNMMQPQASQITTRKDMSEQIKPRPLELWSSNKETQCVATPARALRYDRLCNLINIFWFLFSFQNWVTIIKIIEVNKQTLNCIKIYTMPNLQTCQYFCVHLLKMMQKQWTSKLCKDSKTIHNISAFS